MYAKGMKLPEGKQCAAFITIDLAAEFFWISLDERAKAHAQDPVSGPVRP